MSAFHNDPALKQRTVARVRAHIAAGEVVPLPAHWEDGKGGPAGCAVHDASPQAFEAALGVPRSLLPLVEAIFRRTYNMAPPQRESSTLETGEVAAARAFPADWLQAIEPGADLAAVPTRMVLWMLADPQAGSVCGVADGAVKSLLVEVAAAHREALEGAPPARAAWADLRRRATALTDSLPEGSVAARAATTVETAAWPMSGSGSVALDVFSGYIEESEARAAEEAGWDEQDRALAARVQADQQRELDAAMQTLEGEAREQEMQRIWTEHRDRLRREHPGLVAKEIRFRQAQDRHRWGRVIRCQSTLLDLLRKAPVISVA